MTPPITEKNKTGARARAVFVRIETTDRKPYLALRACSELVTTFLFNFKNQQWFNLIGFVVLPNEIQMIIVPRELTVNGLAERLERETGTLLCQLIPDVKAPIWDAEIYSEPLDGNEAIKSRVAQMHAAPVRARLTANPASYDFSSANPRFHTDLDKLER